MNREVNDLICESDGIYLHIGDEYIRINKFGITTNITGEDETHLEIVGWIDPPVEMQTFHEDIKLEFSTYDNKECVVTCCEMSCVPNTEGFFPGLPRHARIISVWSTDKSLLLYKVKGVTLWRIAFKDD